MCKIKQIECVTLNEDNEHISCEVLNFRHERKIIKWIWKLCFLFLSYQTNWGFCHSIKLKVHCQALYQMSNNLYLQNTRLKEFLGEYTMRQRENMMDFLGVIIRNIKSNIFSTYSYCVLDYYENEQNESNEYGNSLLRMHLIWVFIVIQLNLECIFNTQYQKVSGKRKLWGKRKI